MSDCLCEKCGHELQVGDWPMCPHGRPSFKVFQDSIPGGMWIENMGPTPVKVYSKSERKFEMEKRGLVESVRHIGEPGSDKSRHTSRWV